MTGGRRQDIRIGPRTTVFTLLEAFPFLETFLLVRVNGFERLADERARTRWARVMTIADVALRLDVPWQHLVREIAEEVERASGRPPRVAGAPRRVAEDERRVGELRDIVAGLEDGASLLDMAARWRVATDGLEPDESAALEAVLAGQPAREQEAAAQAMGAAAVVEGHDLSLPAGHPLAALRREAGALGALCDELGEAVERLAVSQSGTTWRREKPGLVEVTGRLSSVEARFRRQEAVWFPVLSARGAAGLCAFLAGRQAETREALRRLRHAVERDEEGSVAELAARAASLVGDLLAQDERLLGPLAEQRFSDADWEAVRAREDGVGWCLIAAPPAWPQR